MNKPSIELLVKEITKVIEMSKEKEKLKPGKMSLLSMFRYSYENAHSDVLRYLLDPNEDHRHGTEYLELFLREVGFDHLCVNDLKTCKVYRESARIDLYIEHKEFSIIIENKIWAEDQPQQLQRYYEIVNEKWNVNKDKIYIIYLTLSGYEASEQSMGNSDDSSDSSDSSDKAKEIYSTLQELRKSEKFLDISYANHILRWLRQLSFKSSEHTLRSAIEQYTYNIEILTHQTEENTNMKQEILSKIKELNLSLNLSIEDSEKISKSLFTYSCTKDLIDILNELQKTIHNHTISYTNNLQEHTLNSLEKILLNEYRTQTSEIGVCIKITENLGVIFLKVGIDLSNPVKYWIGYTTFEKDHKEYNELKIFEDVFKNTVEHEYNTGFWSKENGWYFGQTFKEKPSDKVVIEKLLALYDVVKDIKP